MIPKWDERKSTLEKSVIDKEKGMIAYRQECTCRNY